MNGEKWEEHMMAMISGIPTNDVALRDVAKQECPANGNFCIHQTQWTASKKKVMDLTLKVFTWWEVHHQEEVV